MTMSDRGFRLLATATVAVALLALFMALVWSPREAVMGDRGRILYVHVGAAWTAYLAYAVTALGAVMWLWKRERRWDRLAHASAEWGVVLTTVTLITGSIWGKAVNNWWWDWGDMRLTLTLILWFIYAGYLALRQFARGAGGASAAAVLALIGVPVMVLNHFAVRLWQRSHPGAVVVREGGPAVDPPMLVTILISVVAYTLVYATVLVLRVRLEAQRDAVARMAAA